jgi:hypothetical protein
MTRRLACLSAFLMLVFLPSFGSQDGGNAQNGLKKSQTVSPLQRHKVSRAAIADWSRRMKSPSPPPTQIGFLSGTQTAAGGGTFPNFPAVIGDFNGDGIKDVAAIVNISLTSTPAYNIAAELSNGKGGFTTVLTPTLAVETDAIFVGRFKSTDTTDSILVVHPAASPNNTLIEGWTSNGDGHFTTHGTVGVTTNGFVWATLADVNADGNLDVLVADAHTPNGNIWTLLGNGDGTFQAPTAVSFTGALRPLAPGNSGVPGNPVVFGDFNGDGNLDFAGPAATGGADDNKIVVYLAKKPGPGYDLPVSLATPDSVYDSCFLAGGDLTGDGKEELVSANCLDNNVTVYVNNGSGGFATGVYDDVASNPVGVTVADVNGDGHNDVVASCFRSADVKVLLGDGSGAVAPAAVGYATGGSPLVPPLVADFNGDTKPDVVVPDNEFSFVYLEGYGDGSFRSAVNYYATPGSFEAQAVNIASGDFNGDGIPDFVIGNTNSCLGVCPNTGVTVFLSNPDGSLQTGVNYNSASANFSLQYVAVGDFNGDGKLDIAASDAFNGVVQIFTGKGDGTFTTGATYASDTAATPNPVGLVVGDFNGDGKPDLAVINNHGNPAATANVGILINNGKGGFNTVVPYALSTVATEITAADVNGDKKLDLVVPLYGTSTTAGSAVAILLGNGTGTFQAEKDVSLGANLNPYDAAIGDLNGDGKVDLAVTIEDQSANPSQGIAVALGNGDGTFKAPTLLLSTLQSPKLDIPLPGYVKIVDLNQDGIPDLVYSNSEFSTVGVLYGKGGGAFYDPVEFPADRWAWGLALVDLNGDGGTDVVVSGNSLDFSGVAVLFNNGGNKTTLTSSLNPSNPGTSVTFTSTVAATVHGVTATPTGKVTFNDGSTALGSANLNSSGVATFSTSTLAGGSHSITAHYGGDANFLPKTSAVLNQVVNMPDYSLVANPTSQSVNPGSSATYSITLKLTNSYNGTVNFPASACSGLPAGTACSFSPSSITGSQSTTLTISTAGPTAALIAPPGLTPHKGALDLWASLGGLGLVGMVLAGDWKSRSRRRTGIVLAVLAVLFLMALVGCGGGSSSSGGGGGGGTPAGTYPIQLTVTGTAGTNGGSTLPHNLKVTLVVN